MKAKPKQSKNKLQWKRAYREVKEMANYFEQSPFESGRHRSHGHYDALRVIAKHGKLRVR